MRHDMIWALCNTPLRVGYHCLKTLVAMACAKSAKSERWINNPEIAVHVVAVMATVRAGDLLTCLLTHSLTRPLHLL